MIVLSVCILPLIISSAIFYFDNDFRLSDQHNNIRFLISAINSLLGIALMFYILYIRNENYKDLGIMISAREMLFGVALFLATYTIYIAALLAIHTALPTSLYEDLAQQNFSMFQHTSVFSVIYLLVNPFFEELIVRGFTMTRLKYLTDKKFWIIGISVVVQASYHLYQGLFSVALLTIIFLIFSIFYYRTGRLTPVIIAHLIFDLLILCK